MSTARPATPVESTTAHPPAAYARNATGLVREVGIFSQGQYTASGSPLGVALVIGLFTLIVFPRSNFFIAMAISLFCGVFVWVAFALLTAMMPRIGGDYAFNSRILHPIIGLGANFCWFIGAMMAAGLWSYWVAEQGLSPAFTVIGSVTHSSTLVSWGNFFSASHHTHVFITAVIVLLVMTGLSILGTKVVMRVMAALFFIAVGGFLVDTVILAVTSHASFQSHVASLAGADAYQKTVAAGAHSGLYPTHGYSAKNTIGAVYYTLSNIIFCWVGAYTAAEFKGAGQRKRELQTMLGAGLGQGILVVIAGAIFLSTVGYNFFVSALSGNYTGPGGSTVGLAGYLYFAGVAAPSTFLVVILSLAFMGWWMPGLYVNVGMAQRALLSYSFDGLLPKPLAYVNSKTHTPIVAIIIVLIGATGGAAWVSYSTGFFTVLGIMLLLSFVPMLFVGISCMIVKRRRPDLYSGSPAEWRLGGIEVLPIAGAGCFLVSVAAIAVALYFHKELGFSFWKAALLPVAVMVGAAVWYVVARRVRSRQGVDLDLVYRTIPPE
jgi:basic amino acid/polyamine antiporter, APA family